MIQQLHKNSSQNDENSSRNFHQNNTNITIYHQKCGNFIYYRQIIQLIAQYFEIKTRMSQQTLENKKIDEKLTKKCCQKLKISSVFKKVNSYCLKCQKNQQNIDFSQIKHFKNNKLSFCTQCIQQLYINQSSNLLINESTQYLLHKILIGCQNQKQTQKQKQTKKSLINFLDDQQNQQYIKNLNISQKNLSEYDYQKTQFSNNPRVISQLNKLTKQELIQMIIVMQKAQKRTNDEMQIIKRQLAKNKKLLELNKQKNHELQYQNQILKRRLNQSQSQLAQSTYSYLQVDSVKILLTSKIQQSLKSISKKFESIINSQDQNKSMRLNLCQIKQDDTHSLLHPQHQVRLEKILIKYCPQNATNLQSVIEQQQYVGGQQRIKPITRSQVKFTQTNVSKQDGLQAQFIITMSLNRPANQRNKKNFNIIQPVVVPIMNKNWSNKY